MRPLAPTGYATGTIEGSYDMHLVNIDSLGISILFVIIGIVSLFGYVIHSSAITYPIKQT